MSKALSYAAQRDRPRFTRIDANTQPQWNDDGGSSSSGEVRGTIDVPDWMTERQCLEWNYSADPNECEDWESWDQVQQRVAENHLEDSFLYKEDHQSEKMLPARKWAEAVR